MNDKKYEVMFEKNRDEIDSQFVVQTHSRVESMSKMQDKTQERRSKIMSNRLQLYQNNDKKWIYKTMEIKKKFMAEEK